MRRILFPLLLLAGVAHAEIQTKGPEEFPGKIELTARIGYQAGLSGNFGNPSGLKLLGEFGFKLTDLVWFDAQVNQVVGFSGSVGTCYDNFGRPFQCGPGSRNFGGWATELAAGVKLKIKTPIPLVVEVPITGAVVLMYARECNDGGVAAPVLRVGGQVMYFLTKRIGVGGGFSFAFGPGFHSEGNCGGSYTDFYGSFDFAIGAEFIL